MPDALLDRDVEVLVEPGGDEVVDGLVEAAEAANIGDPFDESSTMGTIVNKKQLDRIGGYIESGKREGATLITGGNFVGDRGYFVQPTVFMGHNDLTIAREEIFGPVATVIPFDTEQEAVALANDTRYGLNAMVYTSDLSRTHRVIADLKVGTVWVNGWGVPEPQLPWGGRDASGIGRELGFAGVPLAVLGVPLALPQAQLQDIP